jgi:hypothetical protein
MAKQSDDSLADALRHARTTPHQFVLIAKGATCLRLLVSRRPIPGGVVQKTKRECGGTSVFRGTCRGDGSEMIFQFEDKEPPIPEVKLRKLIAEETGLNLKPRFQV